MVTRFPKERSCGLTRCASIIRNRFTLLPLHRRPSASYFFPRLPQQCDSPVEYRRWRGIGLLRPERRHPPRGLVHAYVRITPDGMGIVLRRENTVELVDRESGKTLSVLNGKCKFCAMDLSPDGKVVALACQEKEKRRRRFLFGKWRQVKCGRRCKLIPIGSLVCITARTAALLTASRARRTSASCRSEIGSGSCCTKSR